MTPNQPENPFTNPKFLIAIVATFVGLWGWQYYMNKTYPPQAAPVNAVTTNAATNPATAGGVNTATTVASGASSQAAANAQATISAAAEEKEFTFENEKAKWVISSNGMGLKTFIIKDYKDREGKNIEFTSAEHIFALSANNKKIAFNLTQVSDVEYKGEATVENKKITRVVKFDKEKLFFESNTSFEPGLQNVQLSIDEKKLAVKGANFLMPSFEKQDFLYKEVDKIKTEHISGVKEGETLSKSANNVSLAAIGTQYFTIATIDKSEVAPSVNMNVSGQLAKLDLHYDLANSQVKSLNQIYYVGAKDTDILKAIDPVMLEVMDYGMFGFIAKPLLILMRALHKILGNWGLAIIGLTLIVRLIMLPFNILSFKSSRAMQKIQPLLKEVRERYKADPLEVNRRTMAIMKENKANPLSGCLPMLIQIPIFFALWKTIGSSVEIYQQPFFGWIHDLSSHDPFFVIPVLMGITMFFQQKLTPTTMDPMQQKILNFMPIIFTVFMFSLPSGLTLYNFVSALFGVTQQYFLLKDKSAAKAA
ncbi:MAG: membrane protein insertase YidC [Bdellovibrio sp.]|nr:membrane protein insertase YidC [Bdellovibrio sp.]